MLLQSLNPSGLQADSSLPEILRLLRLYLSMDIAFVSEFVQGRREFRMVDAEGPDCPLQPGGGDPLEETYCQRIVNGQLPELIPDVNDFPIAKALPITTALDIQAYIATPIRLADGSLYGTFCCFSHTPEYSLNERDLAVLRVCADMAAKEIDRERMETKKQRDIEQRIRFMLANNRLSIMYQPIYDLRKDRAIGFEALSRFPPPPGTPDSMAPDLVFKDAHSVGLGVTLETMAIDIGLRGLQALDADSYVSVNISPEAILSPTFPDIFRNVPLERVTLEITEHAAVDQYQELTTLLRPARERGLRLAVDDAGAGYASFRHILHLAPDRIKLDISLTKNVDSDPTRRALIAAFVRFAEDTGADLIAEGIETERELEALRQLGVVKAQGFLLGQPMPLAQAAQLLHA